MMDREQIRARQTTIEAHVYSTSGKQGLWDALEHNAWMRNDISDLLAAIDDLEAERDAATRYLGQALTCAMYGLDEMNWKDVEDWLRRDEPEQHDL